MSAAVLSAVVLAPDRIEFLVDIAGRRASYVVTRTMTGAVGVIAFDQEFYADFGESKEANQRLTFIARRLFRGEDVEFPAELV